MLDQKPSKLDNIKSLFLLLIIKKDFSLYSQKCIHLNIEHLVLLQKIINLTLKSFRGEFFSYPNSFLFISLMIRQLIFLPSLNLNKIRYKISPLSFQFKTAFFEMLQIFCYLQQLFNRTRMSQTCIVAKRIQERKKTVLPFIVYRAPIQNHLAYQKKGHWTEKEKLKYVIFLSYFKEKFTSRDKKKRFCRIFKVMSDFIKTRTHNQCRSHHQKMEKQRFQVDSIIKNVVSKYHPRVYQELYERYLIEIENLNLEEHEQYKFRSSNQNEGKEISDSYDEGLKPIGQREPKQRLKTKHQSKRTQVMKECSQAKVQEQYPPVPIILQKKEGIKLTRECQEGEELQNSIREGDRKLWQDKWLDGGRGKSLDFNGYNNFNGLGLKEEANNERSFSEYLQALQIRKMQSLNKAFYHQCQMLIEFGRVAECQKQKSAIIQMEKERMNNQNGVKYGFSNFFWTYH